MNNDEFYLSDEDLKLLKKEFEPRSNKNHDKKKKRKRLKVKNLMLLIIFLVLLIVFIISIIKVISWHNDSKETKKQEEIIKKAETKEVTDNDQTEVIASDEDEDNPYWDYIKMNLMDVDLNELKKINSDVTGWISVNGTNINYPFVQTSDNKYYLKHSLDKSYNEAGWVFLDYRNSKSSYDKNNILYAHGRVDTTMFGSLKNILKSNWYENKNNHVIKTSNEYENSLWQVFSVYKINTTSDYLQTKFNTDEEFLSFANRLKERSYYDFKVTLQKTDKILTLSTCYNSKQRVVMHAKLIKTQKNKSLIGFFLNDKSK